MSPYLWLRSRLVAGRVRAVSVPVRIIMMIAMSAFVAYYLVVSSPNIAGFEAEFAGLATLCLLAAALILCPYNVRFPRLGADLCWLYASPLPAFQILVGELVWVSLRRWAWLLVAVGVGVAAGGWSLPRGVSTLVWAGGLVLAATVITVGASATRGFPARQRICATVGALLLVVGASPVAQNLDVFSNQVLLVRVANAARTMALDVGQLLRGGPPGPGAVVVLAVAALCAASILTAGDRWRRKARDDAAWFGSIDLDELARAQPMLNVGSAKPVSWMKGPAALAWCEYAVIRRRSFHFGSMVGYFATAFVIAAAAPALLGVLVIVALYAPSVTAGSSGLAGHLRLRTFVVPSGSVVVKMAATELPHTLVAGAWIAALLLGAELGSEGPSVTTRALAGSAFGIVLAVSGARMLTVALAWRRSSRLPLGRLMRIGAVVGALAVTLPVAAQSFAIFSPLARNLSGLAVAVAFWVAAVATMHRKLGL